MQDGLRRAWTTRPRRATATSSQALEAVLDEERASCSPDDVDADLFGIAARRARRRGAALRDPRRPRARCAQLGRSTRSSTSPARRPRRPRCCRRAYGDEPVAARARSSCPRCPTTPRSSRLWLAATRRGARRVATRRSPSAATRPRCMQTATLNAQQALMLLQDPAHRRLRRAHPRRSTDMQDALGLAEAPLRIECYDVSHLGGTNIVASMVVFEDGLPRKDQYRRVRHPRDDRRHRLDLPDAVPAAGLPRAGTEQGSEPGNEPGNGLGTAVEQQQYVAAAAAEAGARSYVFAWASSPRASSRKTAPAAVSSTPFRLRSNSENPSSCSRSRSC